MLRHIASAEETIPLPPPHWAARNENTPFRFPKRLTENEFSWFMLRLSVSTGSLASVFSSSEGKNGGEGGIRTLGTLADSHDFQSCTFDHSATSPGAGQTACPSGQEGEQTPWDRV